MMQIFFQKKTKKLSKLIRKNFEYFKTARSPNVSTSPPARTSLFFFFVFSLYFFFSIIVLKNNEMATNMINSVP